MRWGLLIVLGTACAACDPPKPCNNMRAACSLDLESRCDVESLELAVEKVETIASLECQHEDFWVECAARMEKKAQERDQRGCEGERADNRLRAIRRLADNNCSTAEHWDTCFPKLKTVAWKLRKPEPRPE